MFIKCLKELNPGIYLTVEHPAFIFPEMKFIGHIGYTNVGNDRQSVFEVFTSKRVQKVIRKQNIRLISYADLQKKQDKL